MFGLKACRNDSVKTMVGLFFTDSYKGLPLQKRETAAIPHSIELSGSVE
jgi:hypothetical protein